MTVGYLQGGLPGENRGRLRVGLHVRQDGLAMEGLHFLQSTSFTASTQMAGSYATFRDQMPPHQSRKTCDAVNDGLLQGQYTSMFANPSQ